MNKITALLLIIFPLFVIRIYILTNSQLTFYSDDAIYASLARLLLEGDVMRFFHPAWQPLYPALSSFTYLLFQNWEKSLQLVSIISGVALAIPSFFLVRHFLSTTHALIFSMTITLFTPIFRASLAPLSDTLATFLFLGGITAIILGIESLRKKEFFIGSILFGAGFLTRSEGSLFFFLSLAWVMFYLLYRIVKKATQTKKLLTLPIMTLTFLLAISPYLITTKMQLGTWTLSHKFSAQVKQWRAFELKENGSTWIQEVVSIKEPNYKSEYFTGGLEHVMEYSDWFTWWFFQKSKIWLGVFKQLFPIWSIPIIAIGIITTFIRKFWHAGYLVFLMVVGIPLTIFSTPIADPRYLLWTLPLFLLFFYLGIAYLCKVVKANNLSAFVALLLSLTFYSFAWDAVTHPNTYAQSFTQNFSRPEIKKAGEWIRQNSNTEIPKIAMRHEGVEFYADAQTIYIPQVPYDVFIQYTKKNHVDYVVAWVEELAADPELAILLTPDNDFDELKEEIRFEENGRVLVVYSLIN